MPVTHLRHAKHAKIANSRMFLMALRCHPPIARPPWGKHGFPFNKATFSWDILRTFGYERFRRDMQQAASLVERPRAVNAKILQPSLQKQKHAPFPNNHFSAAIKCLASRNLAMFYMFLWARATRTAKLSIMGATTLEVGHAIMTLLPTKKLYCACALFGMLQRESSEKISQSPTPRAAFWAKISVSLPSNA